MKKNQENKADPKEKHGMHIFIMLMDLDLDLDLDSYPNIKYKTYVKDLGSCSPPFFVDPPLPSELITKSRAKKKAAFQYNLLINVITDSCFFFANNDYNMS
jgi:hypothetical protein